LNQDFQDILQALSDQKTEFLVVGAFAVSYHAEPRATGDIDIWVNPTPENAKHAMAALKQFGAPLFDLTVKDLSTSGVVFQMGLPPSRIDILTSISGVTFQEAWTNRKFVTFGNLKIPVLGREELLKNKKASGRPKDLLDVLILEKHQKKES